MTCLELMRNALDCAITAADELSRPGEGFGKADVAYNLGKTVAFLHVATEQAKAADGEEFA